MSLAGFERARIPLPALDVVDNGHFSLRDAREVASAGIMAWNSGDYAIKNASKVRKTQRLIAKAVDAGSAAMIAGNAAKQASAALVDFISLANARIRAGHSPITYAQQHAAMLRAAMTAAREARKAAWVVRDALFKENKLR